MRPAFEFDFEWRITLCTVLLLPLLISLGYWQLHRGGEKSALAVAFAQKQHRPPVLLEELGSLGPQELAYLPVKLQGRFRNEQSFLLDNRMQGRKYGNEVLTVFELTNGELALVNRGWVIADPSRRSLPDVPSAPVAVELTGRIYVSPGEPYLLAQQQWEDSWPMQVQAVDIENMARVIGADRESLFPYPVRIDAGQPGALSVDWLVINVSPEKHIGYAVQWFSMAAALALIYLLRSSNLWQVIRGVPSVRDPDE